MRVSEAMTREVRVAAPTQTIREVAKIMDEIDAGSMPVGEVMSDSKVLYCYEDEELAHVAKNMSEEQVRRLPVVNRDKRLVGIVSLGDLAQNEGRAATKAV